jgi:hypothetical protein
VWSLAQAPILRHGFVNRWHLNRRIHEAVEVQAVQRLLVEPEYQTPRPQEGGFHLWIALKGRLLNPSGAERASLLTSNDDDGQCLPTARAYSAPGKILPALPTTYGVMPSAALEAVTVSGPSSKFF